MSKLRLNLDSIAVETFATTPRNEQHGTVMAFSAYQTRCANTCNLETGCYNTHIDNMCSADCTGLGVMCYTADPNFYDCTGGAAACTGGNACTYTTCTQDNVTCAYNCTATTP